MVPTSCVLLLSATIEVCASACGIENAIIVASVSESRIELVILLLKIIVFALMPNRLLRHEIT